MVEKWSLVILFIMTSLFAAWAQNDSITTLYSDTIDIDTAYIIPYIKNDTTGVVDTARITPYIKGDTAVVEKTPKKVEKQPKKDRSDFSPNSTWSVLFGIFPGGGQIYNRKYWKLPIVYGGAMGIVYAITWNGSYYKEYRNAYRDLVLGEGDAWKRFVPPGDFDESGNVKEDFNKDWFQGVLKGRTDLYRRNRDLGIIGAVVFYAATMIDAFVDAKLYDFDISPDLSLRLEPYFTPATNYQSSSLGISCRLNLKK